MSVVGKLALASLPIIAFGDSLVAGTAASPLPWNSFHFLTGRAMDEPRRYLNFGVGGESISQIRTRLEANVASLVASYPRAIWIFDGGYNDVPGGNVGSITGHAIAMRDALLAEDANAKWLFVGIPNGGANETDGETRHTTITDVNAALATEFGFRFVDVRRYLIDFALADLGLTPTADDLTDISNDVVPRQLRDHAAGVGIHWNNNGHLAVKNRVVEHIALHGYARRAYETTAFLDDFDDIGTIDVDGTDAPGFNWYTRAVGAGHMNPDGIAVTDSILTLGGGTTSSAGLHTATRNDSQSPRYIGTAFGGGSGPYIYEAKLRFDPTLGPSATGQIGFWSMAKRKFGLNADNQWPGQAAGYTHFVEIDIAEWFKTQFPTSDPFGYPRAFIDWSGEFISGNWTGRIDNYWTRNQPLKNVPQPDWSEWHVFGLEYFPQRAGLPGYCRWTLDGITQSEMFWDGPPTAPPLPNTNSPATIGEWAGEGVVPTPDNANETFSIADQQDVFLGLLARSNWPVEFDWVRVRSGDIYAPTLTNPTGAASGATTADIAADTNEPNGATLYWVVTQSATKPTKAQIKAGQDEGGAAADAAGNLATATNESTYPAHTQEIAVTGLTTATEYWAHFMQEDAAGNQSAVSTSASFTTS